MTLWRAIRAASGGVLMLWATGLLAQGAGAPTLTALRGIEPGLWQVREGGPRGPVRTVCIRRGEVLIQLRHPGLACAWLVLDNAAQSATVNYTCPGAGHGRTVVTVDTPRALSIDTQGVLRGVPFQVEAVARRTGACPGG